MKGYCGSCGAPIQGNYKFCSMCSGNPWQPSDNYAQEEMQREEQRRQQEQQQNPESAF